MKKFLFFILIIAFFNARAQRGVGYSNDEGRDFESGWGLALQSYYDVPTANLGYSFKPAISYGASLIQFGGHFTTNITIGYQVFKPKLDTFYYKVDDTSFGKISYQNFTASSAYLGFAYNIRPTDQFWIFVGANLGACFTRYAFHSVDKVRDETDDLNETDVYIAPKAGITYALSDYVLISFESKYNYFAPTGKASNNDRVGTLYSSFANGLAVTFKFK